MLQRLRHRAHGQEGFTLIELLVVILIIGILAAIAIPTFLSQTQKAQDSNVTAYLNSAQNAEATYQTSNNGGYTSLKGDLTNIEPTLNSAPTLTAAVASVANPLSPDGGTTNISNGFEVSDTSPTSGGTGVTYHLYYDAATGTVYKTCSTANKGVCNNSSQW